MKALTIKPFWAHLIAEGQKCFEFRDWATEYRGPLLIHAGTPEFAIVCQVDLIGCIPTQGLKVTHHGWDWQRYAWILRDPKPLNIQRIKGRPGIWEHAI